MSRILEEFAREVAEKATKETAERVARETTEKVTRENAREMAKSLLTMGKLSYEEISNVSKLTVKEIKELDNKQPA